MKFVSLFLALSIACTANGQSLRTNSARAVQALIDDSAANSSSGANNQGTRSVPPSAAPTQEDDQSDVGSSSSSSSSSCSSSTTNTTADADGGGGLREFFAGIVDKVTDRNNTNNNGTDNDGNAITNFVSDKIGDINVSAILNNTELLMAVGSVLGMSAVDGNDPTRDILMALVGKGLQFTLSSVDNLRQDYFTSKICPAAATPEPTCKAVSTRDFPNLLVSGTWVCRTTHNPITGANETYSACIDTTWSLEADVCGCCGGECPQPCTTCKCGLKEPGDGLGVYVQNKVLHGVIKYKQCVDPDMAVSLIAADRVNYSCLEECPAKE